MKRKSLRGREFYQPVFDFTAYWKRFRPRISSQVDKDGKWLRQAALLDELSTRNGAAVALWSTITPNRFVYFTDKSKLLGYDADLFTSENGLAFSYANFHPLYLIPAYLVNEKIVNCIVSNQIRPADKATFSFDAVYKIQNDAYIHFLQQIILLEVNETGHPLLSLSVISDISHIKKTGTCSAIMVFRGKTELCRFDFDKKYFEDIKVLSKQEKNVLQLLGKGFTTMEIAEQLYISPHTADTHRRNLIKKTDCVDTTAVVTYARMTGLL